MFYETMRQILTVLCFLAALFAVFGITLNMILYRNWYGETEEQRRERICKERKARTAAARERE